jgi:uncharacterized protein YaiI (UPF0178 family)
LSHCHKRVRLRAVHLRLGHHRKADAVVQLAEAGDLVVAAGVLAAELVARKARSITRPLVAVVLPELLEPAELRV